MAPPKATSFRKWLLSSPPAEWAVKQLRDLLIGSLRQGPVPQHVAFEMDGNRRYARSRRMETIEGHHHGFEALARVLEICYKSGVKTVTVYAFSIENFNRPKYEVDGLMQLAKVKLEQLTKHGDILDKYGACVRVIGQRGLIRKDVLEVVDKAVNMTKDNKLTVLNICFPYTSREEMTTAMRSTVAEYSAPTLPKITPFSQSRITQNILTKQLDQDIVEKLPTIHDESADESSRSDDGGSSSPTLAPDSPSPSFLARTSSSTRNSLPNPETITEETLDRHMYTADDPPLDLFIRTSGVQRLSDFMLWQCHQDTQIFFLECFWPEFDLQHFIPVLLEWQWKQKQNAREESTTKISRMMKADLVVA